MFVVQVQVLMVVGIVGIAILRTEIVFIVGSTLADGTSRIILQDLDVVLHLATGFLIGRIAIIKVGEMLTVGVNKVTHQNLGECEHLIVLDETFDLHQAEQTNQCAFAILA